jgi:uncharacterized protein (DUF4415 family)
MNESNRATKSEWVDPDDAPELTDEFFEKAVWQIGEKTVTPEVGMAAMRAAVVRGRPVGSTKLTAKQAVTVRYSPDVLAAFKATGAGWQARMNDALRDWLRTHTPA